jgi:co-chaperonin GroES (HSP10)|tara:strand:+ start:1414 stop:1671 length:258 start_codon:yes stop_codon:yes gene_type:complete
MKAINKYIIIKTIEQEVKTSSGLLLSAHDVEEFRYKKGEVTMPGTEVKDIKKGDLIYYDKMAGYTIILEEQQHTIILERDVVVVL